MLLLLKNWAWFIIPRTFFLFFFFILFSSLYGFNWGNKCFTVSKEHYLLQYFHYSLHRKSENPMGLNNDNEKVSILIISMYPRYSFWEFKCLSDNVWVRECECMRMWMYSNISGKVTNYGIYFVLLPYSKD